MRHERVQDLGGVYLVDTEHGGYPATIGVYLLPTGGGRFALIETGPASTLRTVRAQLEEAGFQLDGLEAIFVTHIHLDHAGAAGELSRLTGADVYVHENGAPHLVDPERLLKSAKRIYGDEMDTLWGPVESVPAERVHALTDGQQVTIRGRTLTAIDSPGHASHHHCYLLDDGSLFTGDAAAVRLPGSSVVRPAMPPPEVHLETWEASVDKLRRLAPKRLLLTHYGEVRDVAGHLAAVPERNRQWAEEVLEGMQAGEQYEGLVRRVRALELAELVAAGADANTIDRNRVTSNAEMTVLGLQRYWRKHHPERLPSED